MKRYLIESRHFSLLELEKVILNKYINADIYYRESIKGNNIIEFKTVDKCAFK